MANKRIQSHQIDDDDDYQKRLARFGLDHATVLQEALMTAPGTETFLSTGRRYRTMLQPHVLQTTSLVQLKEWIGIPDACVTAADPGRHRICRSRLKPD